MPLNFKKYSENGERFVKDLADRLGDHDRDRAARILKTVLHLLRDQIPTEESVQLLAQLPMFLKAVYVDGWKLNNRQNKLRSFDEFISEIRYPPARKMYTDFSSNKEAEQAVSIVIEMIREKVSQGEIDDIIKTLPTGMHKLFQEKSMP